MCGANTYVNLPSLSEKAGEGLLSTYVWSLLSQRSEHIREPAFSLREGRFTNVWSEQGRFTYVFRERTLVRCAFERESVCKRQRKSKKEGSH